MTSGLGVRVWGARGSLPRLDKTQVSHGGNTICLEVLHPGKETVILDAGTGIANLGDRIVAESKRKTIHLFFSHYHWDHVMGLPFFGPVYQPEYSLFLYGLQGGHGFIQEMLDVVFSPLYSPIYSPDNLLGGLTIPPHQEQYDIDGLCVKIFELPTIHPGGYALIRIEGDGGSLVYASDVELRSPEVVDQFIQCVSGCDLLICNAHFSHNQFKKAVGWGHSSLEAAHEVAYRAGVKHLLGIHFDILRSDATLERTVNRERDRFSGITLSLAKEGDTIWL